MNMRAGPLLLIGSLTTGMPATAQYSSLNRAAETSRQQTRSSRTRTTAGAVTDPRASPARAPAAALAEEQTALTHAVKQAEAELLTSRNALRREETRVKAGQAARSSLALLRAKVRTRQSQVERLRA